MPSILLNYPEQKQFKYLKQNLSVEILDCFSYFHFQPWQRLINQW